MFEEQKKSAVDKIKWLWWFLKEELPQFLSNWRTVPRLMMVLYGLVFYETMPKLMHEIDVTNPKTKVTSKITLSGLSDFFG